MRHGILGNDDGVIDSEKIRYSWNASHRQLTICNSVLYCLRFPLFRSKKSENTTNKKNMKIIVNDAQMIEFEKNAFKWCVN